MACDPRETYLPCPEQRFPLGPAGLAAQQPTAATTAGAAAVVAPLEPTTKSHQVGGGARLLDWSSIRQPLAASALVNR